uniref:Trophoblast glycoprotein-like n=1 Tax=Salarias fasciatus TaxID=181472 RepID=A0A672GG08_SALFA
MRGWTRRLVLALLALLLGSASAACPPRCECSEAAHTVKCVSKELRSVPEGIPGYTRNLFITGNQISRVGPESFRGLENVTNLSLSNNRITEVESHTFAGLRSLRSLDLSGNQLAVVHPEAFSVANQSLRELNLSRALYNHSAVVDLAMALRWSSLGGLREENNSAETGGNLLAPSFFFSFFFFFFFFHETSLCFNSLSFIVKMMRNSPGAEVAAESNLPPPSLP